MILLIDTTDDDYTSAALFDGKRVKKARWKSSRNQEEIFFSNLRKFISKSRIFPEDLTRIAVVEGPGLFSRVRMGVVVANAMAFSLGIKVIGIKKDSPVTFKALNNAAAKGIAAPFYDKEPNITKPKGK